MFLARSIKERRESKVDIRVPLFKDVNTDMSGKTIGEPYPGEIHMDCMHFGMGNCCLQCTFETQSMNHARYLYDMLIPFTPILSALSQATPIFKGKLSDYDFRWETLEMGTDDRSP